MKRKHLVRILSLMLILAAGCSSESSQDHIAKARKFIEESQLESATIELKNALIKNKDSAQARWLLGQTYLKLGDVQSAGKELGHARKLGWSANDVMPALARALLAQGEYVQVRELPGKGLEPAAMAELMSVQALAEIAQGEIEPANKLIARALEISPGVASIQLVEARILFAQSDLTGALASLKEVLANSPESGTAWSVTGDIKMRQGKVEEALDAYNNAIEYQQYKLIDRLKRALIKLQLQDYDSALSDAETLLGQAPGNPGGNYIKGLVQFQKQQYADAILPLSLAAPAWKQFPLVLFFLGSAHLMQGNLEQAAISASQFVDYFPDNIAGRRLLAGVRLKQGKYVSVQALLSPILDANPEDVAALTLMANALLFDNKVKEGIAVLEKVAELQPESASASIRLGTGLLLGGNSAEATQTIEAALDLDPQFQRAGILLVLNHLQNKNYAEAIKAAKVYQQRHPVDVTSHNLLGKAYQANGQLDAARESFEAALYISPGDPAASQDLARMAIARGDLDQARQLYNTVLEHHRNHLSTLVQLALIDAGEGDEQAMVGHLEQAMQSHPGALEPRLILGRYYLSKGKPERLPPLFATLDNLQRKSPGVLQLRALAQISGAEHQEAQYTLEQILQSTVATPDTHHLLAMAAAGSGDMTKTRQELAAALALDENFFPSRVALARMDLADREMANFHQHLKILTRLVPDSPDVLQLRAAAAEIEGSSAEALEYARKAYAVAPATHTVLELAHYLKVAEENAAATTLMQEWVAEHPQDIPVRLSLAHELRQAGRHDDAIAHYEAILETAPDNLVALTNLAWHLRQSDKKRALELAEHANQLAPDAPEVLDTVAIAAYFNGDYRRAVRSIRRAIIKAPDNPGYRFHNALIQAALGNRQEAVATLESLVRKQAEFAEYEQAMALLAELKN